MKTIKDWNRRELANNEVFHFKNSLRPFIAVKICEWDSSLFIDINEGIGYGLDELEFEGLEFYRDETGEDDDFMGVEVDGKLDWVE